MKKTFKYTAAALLLAGAFGQAQAALLLDGFSDPVSPGRTIIDFGGDALPTVTGSPDPVTDTLLSGANRSISATATGNSGQSTVVDVNLNGTETLQVTSSGSSNGTAQLFYTFDPEDFTLGGTANAFIMDVLVVDLDVSVEMIVKNVGDVTSSSGFKSFTGLGQFYVLFSQFTDPTVFNTNIKEVTLNFKSATAGYDTEFDNLRIDIPTIPEPSSVALIGLGFAGFAAVRKKKQA